jgi:excisionase family DNA binding protein
MRDSLQESLPVTLAAKELGCSSGRVRWFIRNDRLKAEKYPGLGYLVNRRDLEKFIASRRGPGRPKKAA